jgi:DNA polymerase
MRNLFFPDEPEETLEAVYQRLLEEGKKRFPNRIFILGSGDPKSKIVFVGESPGPPDAEFMKPFMGPVGDLLDKILASIGLNRNRIFLTNVVKFISAGKELTQEVLSFFKPFLHREIFAIKPELIVCLGSTPTKAFLDAKAMKISDLRGKFYDFQGISLIPTFNPAYLLRDPTKKREAWEDMKKIKRFLEEKGLPKTGEPST